MNCKNLRIRSRKYIKFFYCKIEDKEISLELCKDCNNREYVKRKEIKGKKHKQTEISKLVKEAVWYRDKHRCIFCHEIVPLFCANAHLVPRSSGGLGIEENIFTACERCHQEQDNGLNSKLYTEYAENYLKDIYGSNWNKRNLIYVKYGEV